MKSTPKYVLLANALREDICSGHYHLGAKLPSEHELMAQHKVSRQTVRRALAVLAAQAYVAKRHGSGTTVKSMAPMAARGGTASKTIAVVTTYIGEYIFPDILRAIEAVLAKNKYHITLFATQNRVDNERRILSEILTQPLAGLIIEGTKTALPNPNIDLYRQLRANGIPIVFIHGWYPQLADAVRVVANDREGGALATRHLIENGHKNIAGIFKSDDIQGHLRYAGYIETLRANNLPFDDDNVLWYTTESRDLVENRARLLVRGCTAAVCYNDEVAVQLITQLKKSGVRVPQDISIISFDNSTYSELLSPRISTCSQHKKQIGSLAAEKIISLVQGEAQDSSVLPWRVVEKESVAYKGVENNDENPIC